MSPSNPCVTIRTEVVFETLRVDSDCTRLTASGVALVLKESPEK